LSIIANIAKCLARITGVLLVLLCLMIGRDIPDTRLYLINMIPFFLTLTAVILGWRWPLWGGIGFVVIVSFIFVSLPQCTEEIWPFAVVGLLFFAQWILSLCYGKKPTKRLTQP